MDLLCFTVVAEWNVENVCLWLHEDVGVLEVVVRAAHNQAFEPVCYELLMLLFAPCDCSCVLFVGLLAALPAAPVHR